MHGFAPLTAADMASSNAGDALRRVGDSEKRLAILERCVIEMAGDIDKLRRRIEELEASNG